MESDALENAITIPLDVVTVFPSLNPQDSSKQLQKPPLSDGEADVSIPMVTEDFKDEIGDRTIERATDIDASLINCEISMENISTRDSSNTSYILSSLEEKEVAQMAIGEIEDSTSMRDSANTSCTPPSTGKKRELVATEESKDANYPAKTEIEILPCVKRARSVYSASPHLDTDFKTQLINGGSSKRDSHDDQYFTFSSNIISTIDRSKAWILDIDLDFFSTGNPYRSIYSEVR